MVVSAVNLWLPVRAPSCLQQHVCTSAAGPLAERHGGASLPVSGMQLARTSALAAMALQVVGMLSSNGGSNGSRRISPYL